MSTLVNVPKNGGLVKNRTYSNFPNWSLIDELFNRDLPSVFSSGFNSGMTLPKVNIKETPESYFVEMAVPGLKKSDFQINLDNDVLSISTEMKEENEQKEENYVRKEYEYASFNRTFSLPEFVNGDKIKADYNDGILNIQLPKKEEAKQKPTRIIKVS